MNYWIDDIQFLVICLQNINKKKQKQKHWKRCRIMVKNTIIILYRYTINHSSQWKVYANAPPHFEKKRQDKSQRGRSGEVGIRCEGDVQEDNRVQANNATGSSSQEHRPFLLLSYTQHRLQVGSSKRLTISAGSVSLSLSLSLFFCAQDNLI